ncbi:hypothetical protein PND17_09580 [Streptococcus thermophilus]|nr:hypothetical protein [Streptococcus thermophilus]WCL60249.1 hypothetical protein PND17_09580 [Streptococcus thermophilus]
MAILTSEDNFFEDPHQIAADIKENIDNPDLEVIVNVDRKAAIEQAYAMAKPAHRLCNDFWPDHAVYVLAGGLRQYLPQPDPASQRGQERRGYQPGQRHSRHELAGPGHGGGPVGGGVRQLSQEARV